MKTVFQFLQSLLLVLAFSASTSAATIDLLTGKQTEISASNPDMVVTDLGSGYKVSYTINQAELTLTPNGDVTWSIPGFSNPEKEGNPVMPYKGDSFVLPIGCDVAVELLESEYVEFSGNIKIGSAPLFDSMSSPTKTTEEASTFNTNGFYPTSIVKTEPLQVYRDRPIATIAVNPIQYDAATSKIRVYTKITYKLSYVTSTRSIAQSDIIHNVDADDSFLNSYVINFNSQSASAINNRAIDSGVVDVVTSSSFTFPKNDNIKICFTGDNIRCQTWPVEYAVRPMSSRSSNNNIIVREDRVWVHIIEDGSTWTEWFDGTTVINGTTYHKLRLREANPDNVVIRDFIAAYMREENNKVYMIAAVEPKNDIFWGVRYYNYDAELLIYDFNLSEGDYMLMTEDQSVASSDIWPLFENELHNKLFLTKKIYKEYEGNIFNSYIFTANGDDNKPSSYEVIKDVGSPTSALCFPIAAYRHDSIMGWVRAVKVYDIDGSLIFDYLAAKMLSADDVECGGVVIEGGCVKVDEAGADCRVDVYDTCGSLVLTATGEACAETSLDGLARGIYIVRVSGIAAGATTLKVRL